MTGDRIAAVDAVPEEGSVLFRVQSDETGEELEAILLWADGAVVGWLNYCQHFTHIRLDKGSGAPLRNGEVVCTNHGAMFEVDSGRCTHGPCEGAYLDGLDVAVVDGDVYLDDPDYAYVGPGPIERDPGDLSSTSNVEF